MTTQRPTTAIIGAGISGLTAGKMLADYRIPYVCFEASDRIGGNWAFQNPNGQSSAYRSLHIDSSKYRVSFKDFPIPEDYPDFPHHTLIKKYLDSYAEAFGLLDHIEFSNPVIRAERLDGGGWAIHTKDGQVREFEFLVVANGHHWDPNYARFPGEFTGESIHSHYYIDPEEPLHLKGKRILVVGIGNSAADITVELSSRTLQNEVYLSTRSGAWIVPKYIRGKVADRSGDGLLWLPPKAHRFITNLFAEQWAGDPSRFGLKKPEHRFSDAHTTQSVELPLRLGSGDVVPKPNISRLDGQTVHFEDGSSAEIDVIIYATGYNITFPFFDPELISAPSNKIPLYKRILKPGMPDIAFAGFAQALPTLFAFVETQAQLIAEYAAGTYRPPVPEEMERIIREDEQLHAGNFADRPRHTQQINLARYELQMAREELPTGRARAAQLGPMILASESALELS